MERFVRPDLLHEVDRVCYLAGPRDFVRPAAEFASWFIPYYGTTLTPKDDMRGLVSSSDAWRAIEDGWEQIGVFRGVHGRLLLDPDGDNGHEEVISSAQHSGPRIQACFSDTPLTAAVPALPPLAGLALAAALAGLGACARR